MKNKNETLVNNFDAIDHTKKKTVHHELPSQDEEGSFGIDNRH